MPLKIVATQDVLDLVDDACAGLTGLLAKCSQVAIVSVGSGSDVDLSQAAYWFSGKKAVSVDPQPMSNMSVAHE